MTELNEDPERTADEMLDWLCWSFYYTGERFFPPEETAEECIEAAKEDGRWDEEEHEYREGMEYGKHGRAWSESVEFYDQMVSRGFDPVRRTHRHIEESELDLPEADDWEWLPENIKHERYENL